MSDDYGIRIIEVKCGNTRVHKEHEWRHGFLNLKKTKCEGRPPLTEDELWKAANPNIGHMSYKLDADPLGEGKTHNQSVAEKIIPLEQIDLDFNMSSHIGEVRAVWNENFWNGNCNALELEYLKDPLKDRETFALNKVQDGKWSPNTARRYLGMTEHRHSYKLQKIHSKAFIWFRCSDCKIEAVIPRMTLGYPNPWQ